MIRNVVLGHAVQKEGLKKQVKTQEADTEGLKSEVEALTQTVLILSKELNKVTQAHMGDRFAHL